MFDDGIRYYLYDRSRPARSAANNPSAYHIKAGLESFGITAADVFGKLD
jgi:hypothetical protein